MNTVKVGDVVMLKSGGGPRMTVSYIPIPNVTYPSDEEYAPQVRATCVWFDGDILRQEKFPPAALAICDI
ncbi:MAG: YodC family protein [Pseudomonadota bacterium]|nr:YodC family protein [Pseudomonadota bacterium]